MATGSPSTITYSHIRVAVNRGTGFTDGEFFISVSLGDETRKTNKVAKSSDGTLSWSGHCLDFALPKGASHSPKLVVTAHRHSYKASCPGTLIGTFELDAKPHKTMFYSLKPSNASLSLVVSYWNATSETKLSPCIDILKDRARKKSGEPSSGGTKKKPLVANGRSTGRLGVLGSRLGISTDVSQLAGGSGLTNFAGHLSLTDRTHDFDPQLASSSPFTRAPSTRNYPHDPPTDWLIATAVQAGLPVPSIVLHNEEPQYGDLSMAAGGEEPNQLDIGIIAHDESESFDGGEDTVYLSPEGIGAVGGTRINYSLMDASTMIPYQSPDEGLRDGDTEFHSFFS